MAHSSSNMKTQYQVNEPSVCVCVWFQGGDGVWDCSEEDRTGEEDELAQGSSSFQGLFVFRTALNPNSRTEDALRNPPHPPTRKSRAEYQTD